MRALILSLGAPILSLGAPILSLGAPILSLGALILAEVESSGVEMRQAARLISVCEFNGTIFPST
jgi:hypothetical protein